MEFEIPSYKIEIVYFDALDEKIKNLLTQAMQARKTGHQPVSHFAVGAAISIEEDETIYTGSNVENVNFNSSTHAEQHAVNCALQQKKSKTISISQIAIVGAMDDDDAFKDIIKNNTPNSLPESSSSITDIMDTFVTPCGHCRQIYSPFINDRTKIYLLNTAGLVAILPAKSLLPFVFSKIG